MIIEWSDEAQERLKKAPFFVRKMVRKKVNKEAEKRGVTLVTSELIDAVKNKQHDKPT